MNRIQNLRKDKGFNVTDRIRVKVSTHPNIQGAINGYAEYIKSETLAESLEMSEVVKGDDVEWLDDSMIKLHAEVIS